jgi:hypothetical protein
MEDRDWIPEPSLNGAGRELDILLLLMVLAGIVYLLWKTFTALRRVLNRVLRATGDQVLEIKKRL